jgi:hypothetical protein
MVGLHLTTRLHVIYIYKLICQDLGPPFFPPFNPSIPHFPSLLSREFASVALEADFQKSCHIEKRAELPLL